MLFSEARLWGPLKELERTINAAIHKKKPDAVHDLEVLLKLHKPDFISLLKNPVSFILLSAPHVFVSVFFKKYFNENCTDPLYLNISQ